MVVDRYWQRDHREKFPEEVGTVRCSLCPSWEFTGLLARGSAALAAHRRGAHPEQETAPVRPTPRGPEGQTVRARRTTLSDTDIATIEAALLQRPHSAPELAALVGGEPRGVGSSLGWAHRAGRTDAERLECRRGEVFWHLPGRTSGTVPLSPGTCAILAALREGPTSSAEIAKRAGLPSGRMAGPCLREAERAGLAQQAPRARGQRERVWTLAADGATSGQPPTRN